MAWLHAFHRLSVKARPEAGLSMCAEWTAVMIEERHFQTAATFELDVATGTLTLIDGLSHAALKKTLSLDEVGRRLLRERRDGVFQGSNEPEPAAFAKTLGLQSFLWFAFPTEAGKEIRAHRGRRGGSRRRAGDGPCGGSRLLHDARAAPRGAAQQRDAHHRARIGQRQFAGALRPHAPGDRRLRRDGYGPRHLFAPSAGRLRARRFSRGPLCASCSIRAPLRTTSKRAPLPSGWTWPCARAPTTGRRAKSTPRAKP